MTSSLVASTIWEYAPRFLDWFGTSSISLIISFIDSRIKKAAVLEFTDYSYFLILLTLIVFALFWWEVSRLLKKKILTSQTNEDKEKDEGDNKKFTIKSKILLYFLNYLIWTYFLVAFTYVIGDVITMNSIIDFRHHMRILAPYIIQEEKNKIISQWSLMQNFSDYKDIYTKLNKIAEQHNITLKPNKMY